MSLRFRLTLVLLLTAVPLLAGGFFLQHGIDENTFRQGLAQFVTWRMDIAGGLTECEEHPKTWRGFRRWRGSFSRHSRRGRPTRHSRHGGFRGPPPPPVRNVSIWAYDLSFASRNPNAPAFPTKLESAIRNGRAGLVRLNELPPDARRNGTSQREYRHSRPAREPRVPVAFAMRVGDDESPAAVILVLGKRRVRRDGALWWLPIALCGGLLLAVLIATGPIVRRIRRLTYEVSKSATSHYAEPVPATGSDEIADLAHAFNKAGADVRRHLASIEEREQTLRSFIGNTTHDVMIPLTVLQGHLATLRARLERKEHVQPSVLASALNEAHYIGSILHNLSAVAKLEGGEVQLREDPVDLNELVERVIARHKPMAKANRIGLDYAVPQEPILVRGDVTLLEQAVSNVVHNAIRYNRSNGNVAVLLERVDTGFSLRIIDDGPGIPEAELARLPERRFRGAEARTRHPEGLGSGQGLGLYIARDVAKRHGFELELRPSQYGGLEVELCGQRKESSERHPPCDGENCVQDRRGDSSRRRTDP